MIDSYTRTLYTKLHQSLSQNYILGQEMVLQNICLCFLARGHVLLEGPPGTAKTLTAKLLASMLAKSFKRIQFTSDLLPGDIIGTHIYNPERKEFQFIKGPLFADFIVADEINRTPPRTQSALLEAMEEKQVTVEGTQMKLSSDFFVIATQNPQDFEGTFALPEVQLDRFLMKLKLNHADASIEGKILNLIIKGQLPPKFDTLTPLDYNRAQIESELNLVRVDESLQNYIAQLLKATRQHVSLESGSSIRGGIALLTCSRALALILGRDFVIPDDIKSLAKPILSHRIRVTPEARLNMKTEEMVLEEILKLVPFPKN